MLRHKSEIRLNFRISARIEALKSSIESTQRNANREKTNDKNHAYTNGDESRIKNASEMLEDLLKKSENNHKAKAASTSIEQQKQGQISKLSSKNIF